MDWKLIWNSRNDMKCLTEFIRKVCKRRRTSEIGIADRGNDLGAMALAVASELFYGERFGDMDKDKREFGDKWK